MQSLELSLATARQYFASSRAWTRSELERTPFYGQHRAILDQPRGSGYWLWKPYIIRERLRQLPAGEFLMYLDAGARLVADPSPLVALCDSAEILLFQGHYDGFRGRPHVCSAWTKRDCFVGMGCDEPRFHSAPMADASVLLLKNSPRAVAFVDEWLQWACREDVLTDAPNTCGRDDLEDFVEHRHDQSILSLLAAREGIELHRGPGQRGEAQKALFPSSRYETLIDHHRLRTIRVGPPSQRDAGGADVTCADVLRWYARDLDAAPRVLQLGGTTPFDWAQVLPGATVTAVNAPHDGIWERLRGQRFDLVTCDVPQATGTMPLGLAELFDLGILAERFVLLWTRLPTSHLFRIAAALLRAQFGDRLTAESGTARASETGDVRIVGVLSGAPPEIRRNLGRP